MKSIFDFDAMSNLLSRPDFSFAFDAMCGVAGPFVKQIFVEDLKQNDQTKAVLLGCDPLPDFGMLRRCCVV